MRDDAQSFADRLRQRDALAATATPKPTGPRRAAPANASNASGRAPRVMHDADDFDEFRPAILTLKDKPILPGRGDAANGSDDEGGWRAA